MGWLVKVEPVVMYQVQCAEIDCPLEPITVPSAEKAEDLRSAHWRYHQNVYEYGFRGTEDED